MVLCVGRILPARQCQWDLLCLHHDRGLQSVDTRARDTRADTGVHRDRDEQLLQTVAEMVVGVNGDSFSHPVYPDIVGQITHT